MDLSKKGLGEQGTVPRLAGAVMGTGSTVSLAGTTSGKERFVKRKRKKRIKKCKRKCGDEDSYDEEIGLDALDGREEKK